MATKANAGAANLIPGGNRKGTTGVRKKVTKSLIEWLEEVVADNKQHFAQTLLTLYATDPEKYAKTMTDIFKLIVPKQIQAELAVSGEVATGPPVINFHFGGKNPEAAAAALETTVTLAEPETSAQEVFTLKLPVPSLTEKTKKHE